MVSENTLFKDCQAGPMSRGKVVLLLLLLLATVGFCRAQVFSCCSKQGYCLVKVQGLSSCSSWPLDEGAQ